MSLLFHGALLAATALFMPPMAMADEGTVTTDQAYLIQAALEASAMRDQPESKDLTQDASAKDNQPAGGSGQRAAGDEGKMGSMASKNLDGRYTIEGKAPKADLMLSREQAIKDAATFGMVGMLASLQSGPLSPTAPWGADIAVGADDDSKLGNMWARTPTRRTATAASGSPAS